MITDLIALLAGKKTYIVAVLLGLLHVFGPSLFTPEQMTAIQGVLAAFGLVALRLAIQKDT